MNTIATDTDKMNAKAMYNMARAHRNLYWKRVTTLPNDAADADFDHLMDMFQRWDGIAKRHIVAARMTRKLFRHRNNY